MILHGKQNHIPVSIVHRRILLADFDSLISPSPAHVPIFPILPTFREIQNMEDWIGNIREIGSEPEGSEISDKLEMGSEKWKILEKLYVVPEIAEKSEVGLKNWKYRKNQTWDHEFLHILFCVVGKGGFFLGVDMEAGKINDAVHKEKPHFHKK